MIIEQHTQAPGKSNQSEHTITPKTHALRNSLTPVIGTNYFNFVGSGYDTPRDWILGAAVSKYYCRSRCQAFVELTLAGGTQTKEVTLKVVGGRARMGFYYYPLHSQWLIAGFGPDISLRYDKLTHQYNDVISKDKITSVDLGLGLQLKIPLREDETAQGRGTNKFIVISYRAFAQRVLRNCKNVANTDAPFEGCRDAKALQTWEDFLVHGGGYEASVGLEFRF